MFSDFEVILNKITKIIDNDEDLDKISDYFLCAEKSIFEYKKVMILARKSKSNELISNDEYKRFREVARYILPEGRMTELYVTFYIDDFEKYLMLRDSEHTQDEHTWIAREMKKQYNSYIKSELENVNGLSIDG
jgi:thymidylate synthase ThyX